MGAGGTMGKVKECGTLGIGNMRPAFKLLSLLLLLTYASSLMCAQGTKGRKYSTNELALEKNKIRHAVFSHLFKENHSSQKGNAGVYCLSIEGENDPGPDLMAQFASNVPPVRKNSQCGASQPNGSREDLYGAVIDKATGKTGIRFEIQEIKLIGDKKAEVRAGYYEGVMSSSTSIYFLVRKSGQWLVAKSKLQSLA